MNNTFFNLTLPQKAIFSMEQFYPNTSMNTISGKISIHAKIDVSLLQKAIHIFIKNTSNIRYQLHYDQEEVVQYEKEYKPFKIDHIKLNKQNEEEICNKISTKIFSLYDQPLYYFSTFQNEDLTGGFFICVHHIITDAWAMSILINSIISIYSSLLDKKEIDLNSKNSLPYSNFINQENNYIQSPKFKQDELYWNEVFCKDIFNDSTFIKSSPSILSCQANRIEFKLSKNMTSKIINFCKQIKISPFTFILFTMGIYESKIKQTNNVVLSSPILNRTTQSDKQTFGLFVNNILINLNIYDETSFLEGIRLLSKSQFSYFRHQKYPLQHLIADIKNKFNIKESLYDTSVSYQNAKTNHCIDNVNYDSKWLFSGFSAIPLLLHIYDMDDTNRFSFIYDYQTNAFTNEQIKDMHNHLLYICEQVIENSDILIKDIELATPEERDLVLNEFNKTQLAYDNTKTILDLFDKQVALCPSKTAIICEDHKISFKELDILSDNFSAFLQNKYNITKRNNICVILDRSIDLIVVTLAILKCGCSYVLIDPSHPEERINYMIQNSNSKYVISNLKINRENIIHFDSVFNIKISTNYKKPNISSQDPMYLLYTSGSTGLPKAVTVTHKNFHNYFIGISKIINYDNNKVVLSMASISFDVFGYELWVTLLNGLTLVLSSKEEQNNFTELSNLIYRYQVNILYGTPSKIQSLLSVPDIKTKFSSVSDIGIGRRILWFIIYIRFKKCYFRKYI